MQRSFYLVNLIREKIKIPTFLASPDHVTLSLLHAPSAIKEIKLYLFSARKAATSPETRSDVNGTSLVLTDGCTFPVFNL